MALAISFILFYLFIKTCTMGEMKINDYINHILRRSISNIKYSYNAIDHFHDVNSKTLRYKSI
jgi:hypothetical protein